MSTASHEHERAAASDQRAAAAAAAARDATMSPPSSSRAAIAGLALATLLPALDTSIVNVALPTLAQEFGARFSHVQWVVLAYLLAITSTIVSAGRMGDILGRRRVLLAGIVLFTITSMACGAAPTLPLLIAARAAQGIAAAVLMSLALATMREAVPAARSGRAIGMLGTTSAIGTALGPSLGGLLIHVLGWRAIFLINLPLGMLTLLLARRLPRTARQTATEVSSAGRPRFDVAGTLLLALSLSAYALAMTTGREGFGAAQAVLLGAAVAGAGLFAVVEMRTAAPLVAPALLRERPLAAGVVMTVLVMTVVMASLVVGPFHLSRALGLDAVQVGLAMSCGPLAAALAGIPAGRLVDAIGALPTMRCGLAALAIGSAALALMPTALGVPGYIGPLIALTVGYAVFQAANTTAVMTSSRSEQRGVVAGVLTLARNIGLITGTAAMGALFARASGGASDAGSTAHDTRVTFGVASALLLVAFVVAVGSRSRSARG